MFPRSCSSVLAPSSYFALNPFCPLLLYATSIYPTLRLTRQTHSYVVFVPAISNASSRCKTVIQIQVWNCVYPWAKMNKLEVDAEGYHSRTDDGIQMDLATRPRNDATAGGRAVVFSAAIQDAARVLTRGFDYETVHDNRDNTSDLLVQPSSFWVSTWHSPT